jgi:hypothetical protein
MTDEPQSTRMTAREMFAQYEQPLILSFQPSHFRILAEPDELREWEANLALRVGLRLPPGALGGLKKLSTCCSSECPSIPASGDNIDDDDSDID